MPIPEDGSLLDAMNIPLVGFGQVSLAENQDGLPHYVSETMLPCILSGFSALVYALKIYLFIREERKTLALLPRTRSNAVAAEST